MNYNFQRYLQSKKTVDDRALNAQVWTALGDEMAARQAQGKLRVLELGVGVGTMVERLKDHGFLTNAHYTGIDIDADNIKDAAARLNNWDGVEIELETIDLFDFIERKENVGTYDLLIAHAMLDLFDLPLAMPKILSLLAPNGLVYFTLNFDGGTIFQPTIDRELDQQIEDLYHLSMDERIINGKQSGDSQSGRHMFGLMADNGMQTLAAGSSDWVVFGANGTYIGDEAYFLHHILYFFDDALTSQGKLDKATLDNWLTERHAQIERGELAYIAHQLDFLAQKE